MIPLLFLLLQSFQPTPNDVIVFVLDDFSAEARTAANTPALDAIASAGVNFQRAYAMPNCSPARYAALYGRWPRRSGVGSTVDKLDPDMSPAMQPERELLSLAEVAKANGYRTAIVGKWHLGRADLGPLDPDCAAHVQGFDDYLMGQAVGAGAHGETHYDWRRTDNGEVIDHEIGYTGDLQRDAAIAWWQAHEGERRFLWVALNPPHPPQDTPPGLQTPVFERDRYLQVCAYVDGLVDDVLSVVNPATTLTVVFGDNGTPNPARPNGATAGRWKGTTYDTGTRVPLIVRGPGIPTASPSGLISCVDIPRLIADYLCWPLPSGTFEDARPFGVRNGSPGTGVLLERYQEGIDDVAIVLPIGGVIWKYRHAEPGLPVLFNLTMDPGELSPYAIDDPSVSVEAGLLLDEAAMLPARSNP